MNRSSLKSYAIPGNLNIFIFFLSSLIALLCLYQVEAELLTWKMIPWAILFSFVANTQFSLLHEAVHGVFHPHRGLNNLFGRLCGIFFPTSFSLQQIYHLGHHRRNRTDAEMFDLYYKGDKIWLKKLMIFAIMSGLYWASAPISCVIMFLFPNIFRSQSFINSRFNRAFKSAPMLEGALRKSTPVTAIRGEVLFVILFWVLIFYSLKISFLSWIICFWFFGVNWGSLQYTDHAFTPRDIRNGAWNLKVNPVVRYLFLNYHFHQVHHQYPNLPWIHLPKFAVKDGPMPGFFSIYWRLWKGPELATEESPKLDTEFEKQIYAGTPYEF